MITGRENGSALNWTGLVGCMLPHEALGLLRRRFDKSQHDVALKTGIPANYISMYERGGRVIPDKEFILLFQYYAELAKEAPHGAGRSQSPV